MEVVVVMYVMVVVMYVVVVVMGVQCSPDMESIDILVGL